LHADFIDHEKAPGDIRRMLQSKKIRREDARLSMVSLYRGLPYELRAAYKSIFTHLANRNLPFVFHCAAGKDRTGVAAALVLSALGVPYEIIEEDYLLTEACFERSCSMLLGGRNNTLLAEIEQEIWEPLMRADHTYLRAAFDQILAAHGSIDAYLHTELDVSQSTVAQIRCNLLE
jgi:protein-tyrosine phosphatase